MGFYADRIVPVLIDLSMRNKVLRPYRQRVIGAAEGRVLEIGIGSGLNLPWYGANVARSLVLTLPPGCCEGARDGRPGPSYGNVHRGQRRSDPAR